MSLSNKLNYIGKKIDYYTNILNKKTDELNNINFENDEVALKKWILGKKKLDMELNELNKNINNFGSNSYALISSIKKNKNFKFKFGSDSDNSDDSDDSDDSDNSNDSDDESVDNSEYDFKNERFKIFNNDDTKISFYNIKKAFILSEKDYNKKILYCLVYGVFLLYNNPELYNTKIYKNEFLENFEKSIQSSYNFLTCLKKNNAYVSGGFINMCINYPVNNYLFYTDIDIYINKRNFLNFYYDLTNNFNISNGNIYLSSAYQESFFKKNGLLCRLKLVLNGQIQIDILIIRDDREIEQVISEFDLTYCSVYIDPSSINLSEDNLTKNNPNEWKYSIKGEINDMLKKSGKLRDEYANKYLFNPFIQKRLNKYTKRGYKTEIKASIDEVYQINVPQPVTDSLQYHTLFASIKNLYHTISHGILTYNLSYIEYNQTNLDTLCKFISNHFYNTDYYYLYYEIKTINLWLNDVIDSMNDDELKDNISLQKLIIMMKELKETIINYAITNQFPYQMPIPNLTIFKNQILIDYFKDLYDVFKNNDDESIEDSLDNVWSKLETVIRNEEKKIVKEKRDEILIANSIDLSNIIPEFLLQTKNKWLNNPSLIIYNIIIINNIYLRINYNKPNIIPEAWYLQYKISKAVSINEDYFTKTIKNYFDKYSNYDKERILQRKIFNLKFFELLMYNDDVEFFNAFEDNDNIIFIEDNGNSDIKKRYNGFIYNFDTLKNDDLQEFNVECTGDVLSVPRANNLKNSDKWYNQLGSPHNIGISTSQYYQALSLYENSNKNIRVFIFKNRKYLNHITNVKNINWDDNPQMLNIFGFPINLVGATHCGIGMFVYEDIIYLSEADIKTIFLMNLA